MLALLSKSRGDLDQRLKISQVNGEEHYNFSGVMLFSVFAVSMSQWILGSKIKLNPVGEILAIAMIKDRYWVPNGSSANAGVVSAIVGGRREVPSDRQQIVFAEELYFYNIRRESKMTSPIAKIRCRSCGGRSYELVFLDCTTEEAILLINKASRLNINHALNDVRVETLINEYPVR